LSSRATLLRVAMAPAFCIYDTSGSYFGTRCRLLLKRAFYSVLTAALFGLDLVKLENLPPRRI
jgi:hypothetical protein